jgi:hypothetical protein
MPKKLNNVPTCQLDNCTRKGKDMYVYSDGEFTIAICYACGAFDGTGSPEDLLEQFVSEPEIILALIHTGHLIALN